MKSPAAAAMARAGAKACLIAVCLLGAASPIAALDWSCVRVAGEGKGPFWITDGDWNGDGKPDLAVTYVRSGQLSSFLNLGARAFRPAGTWEVGKVPRGIAAGDMDGDGHLDLAVANATSHDVALLRGGGDGTFSPRTRLRAGVAPFHTALVDLDRDGKLDLIVVNESNANQRPGMLSLYHGVGDGSFTARGSRTAGRHPSAFVWADVDGADGADLVVANWGSVDLSIFLRAPQDLARDAIESSFRGGPVYGAAADDFDGDGAIDLAVTDVGGSVHLLRGDRAGHFREWQSLATAGSGTRHVVAVDLDGDGRTDLLTSDMGGRSLSFFRRLEKGAFAPAQPILVGERPRMVLARDLDGDGRIDLAVANQGEDAVWVLFQSDSPGKACTTAVP